MKMKRRLLTAFATAVLAAAATLTIFAASPKDEAAIRYLEQQPLPLDSIIMRLDALEPYGVSYEQVGGGLPDVLQRLPRHPDDLLGRGHQARAPATPLPRSTRRSRPEPP